MAWQLIYTSVPRGLVAGRSGFCTVARHPEIRDRLVTEIERVSAYDRVATDVQGQRHSPVISSHRIMDVGGGRYHLLSRIQEAGLDYTGRSAHIAHHLICDANEITRAGSPARILRCFPWRTRWDEPPRNFTAAEQVDFSTVGMALSLPAIHWRQETGNAANAVLPVENIAPTGCVILGAGGEEERLLSLFEESLLLLDPNRESPSKLWQVRFTTFLQPSDNPADFDWRGGWAGNTEPRRGIVLDLTRPESLPKPQSPSLARIAETGVHTENPGVRPPPKTLRISAIQASTEQVAANPVTSAHVEAGQQRIRRGRGIVIGVILLALLLLLALILNARSKKEQQAKELSEQAEAFSGEASTLGMEAGTLTNQLTGLQDQLGAIPSADSQFQDQAARTARLTTGMQNLLLETKALRAQIEEARKLAEDGQLDEARLCIEAIQTKIDGGNNKIANLRQQADTLSNVIAQIVKTREQYLAEASQRTNTIAPPITPVATVTNAPSIKAPVARPAGLDRLSGDWTYVGITNMADGVNLRSLFNSRGFFKQGQLKVFPAGLETRILPFNEPQRWDTLPDVKTQGTALDLRKDKLYSGMMQWAALSPDDCIFSRMTGANSVVSFQFDQSALLLILLDNTGRLFPPVKLPAKDWLVESPAQFTVPDDLLQTIHLRSLTSPQATKFRLASSNLTEFKHNLKSTSKVRLSNPAVTMDDRGSASGLTLDFGAYRESLSNELQSLATRRLEAGKQLPPEYTMYLNAFKDAGASLLTNSCPDDLKDFRSALGTRPWGISGDPWSDAVDYVHGLFALLDMNDAKPYLKQCAIVLSQIKNKEKADITERRITVMGQSLIKVRELFDPAKTDYRKFDGIVALQQFDLIECKGFADPSTCRALEEHYRKIQNFQFVINDLWSKIHHQVEQERRSFAGNKAQTEGQTKLQKASEDGLKDALTKLDAVSKTPGVITLEMEVAPATWWPLIEFTEN